MAGCTIIREDLSRCFALIDIGLGMRHARGHGRDQTCQQADHSYETTGHPDFLPTRRLKHHV
jgi:hypothetical protein